MWPLGALLTVFVASQTPQAAPPARRPAATDPWPDSRPFTHLFQNLGKDTRALATVPSLEIFAVGGAATAAIHPADHPVADWVARQGPASYTRAGNILGLGGVQAGAAVGTYVIGRLTHQPAAVHIGGDLIRAQLLTGIITQGLKFGVGRTRPYGGPRSFPSGHASAVTATAAVMAGHFGWRVRLPLYSAVAFVSWTRVRDHVHYPSDVVFGATVGLLVGHAVTDGHRPKTWAVVPVRTSGGMAVYVVRTK
jgi:membrane-associated phospholipid phosphatase